MIRRYAIVVVLPAIATILAFWKSGDTALAFATLNLALAVMVRFTELPFGQWLRLPDLEAAVTTRGRKKVTAEAVGFVPRDFECPGCHNSGPPVIISSSAKASAAKVAGNDKVYSCAKARVRKIDTDDYLINLSNILLWNVFLALLLAGAAGLYWVYEAPANPTSVTPPASSGAAVGKILVGYIAIALLLAWRVGVFLYVKTKNDGVLNEA